MVFERINKSNFNDFYDLLEEAFPFVERKTKDNLLKDYLSFDKFYPCFIYDNDINRVGLISYWNFGDFIFVEHLAIFSRLRNKTLGTQAFTQFLKSFNVPIVFEVEKPYNEISKRRINFYKRIGVVFNDFEYFQPSYHRDNDKVPMLIASFPNSLTNSQYEKFIRVIKKSVYGLNQ